MTSIYENNKIRWENGLPLTTEKPEEGFSYNVLYHGIYTDDTNDPLKYVVRITYHNDSDYDSRFCNDGGSYWYTTTYTNYGSSWLVEYDSSTSFSYCKNCGEFGHSSAFCREEPTTVPREYLIDEIRHGIEPDEYLGLDEDRYYTVEYKNIPQ